MNLHYLELFYYVARHRGISRALAHIPYGIQQPAVSSQLISLEKDLGVSLFQRRPFRLTRQGEALYEFVRPFFGRMGGIEALLRSGARHLRIGAVESVVRSYLPGPLQQFRAEFPGVRLSLRGGGALELLGELAAGDLDLVIGPVAGGVPKGISVEILGRGRHALMVPDSEKARSAASFLKHRAGRVSLISLPHDEPITRLFLDELARRGIDWQPSLELEALDLIGTYVAGGFGVGLVTDAPVLSVPPGCRLLPLRGFPKIEVAAFHAGRLDEVGHGLLKLIRKESRRESERGS